MLQSTCSACFSIKYTRTENDPARFYIDTVWAKPVKIHNRLGCLLREMDSYLVDIPPQMTVSPWKLFLNTCNWKMLIWKGQNLLFMKSLQPPYRKEVISLEGTCNFKSPLTDTLMRNCVFFFFSFKNFHHLFLISKLSTGFHSCIKKEQWARSMFAL